MTNKLTIELSILAVVFGGNFFIVCETEDMRAMMEQVLAMARGLA